MALLTAEGISKVALALLGREIVLPATVTQVPMEEFKGSNGDTITVRVPQPAQARTQSSRGADITYDDIDEVPVKVTMSHLYHAKLLSDEEAAFDLENFGLQITRPQVQAVALGAEDQLVAVMNALTPDTNVEFAATADDDDTIAVLLAIREFLTKSGAPTTERYCAVSPSIATRILSVPNFSKINESGSDSALRRAVIGVLYGMTFVESAGLDDDTMVGYHSSGFCWANGAPPNPRGATESAAIADSGISLRQVFQYVPDKLSDASVLSTFAGAAAVLDDEESESESTESEESGDTQARFIKVAVGS
ncbi:MAG: hypothetical protein EPN91_01705 [Salinibacterium sp.]|nr:MAG: hypothetical protein EPN91_01705 [Salinibacterium sp.]